MINCIPLYYDMDGRQMSYKQWLFSSSQEFSRSLRSDEIGEYRVSTIHVGVTMHLVSGQMPVIFETLIFGPKGSALDMWQDRYTSKFSALIGHEYACRLARGEVVETDSGEME
jgi:hypothetical protein